MIVDGSSNRSRSSSGVRRVALAFGLAVFGLAVMVALAGCTAPAAVPTETGAETPIVAQSPLAESPVPQVTPVAPDIQPAATPSPSATPDPFLDTIAHLAPAERADDQTAADADWPIPTDAPGRQSPTPESKTVDQTVTHVVVKGETLSSVASAHGVSVDVIARANNLGDGSVLSVGQRLAIPTGKKATITEERRVAPTLEPHFIWPARAPITTYFNEKGPLWKGGWHTGLDLGANYGTPIIAAEAGLVLEAGWATTRGYGNYVKLDNGLGYNTLYGHMSVIRVKEGQWVNRGDRIGDVGSTGVSTGPHLHFEVRINGQPVDPLRYLPK